MTEPLVPVLVAVGPPGAGKSTALRRLTDANPGMAHFNERIFFGQQRQRGTELGELAGRLAREQRWVPDQLMAEAISQWLGDNLPTASSILIEGFPRNGAQCHVLDEVLTGHGLSVDVFLYIDVDDRIALSRVTGRLVCPRCETWVEDPIPVADDPCQRCGGDRVQRRDDAPDVMRDRLAHHRRGAPDVRAHYAGRGVLRDLSGAGSRDDVATQLFDELAAVHQGQRAPRNRVTRH